MDQRESQQNVLKPEHPVFNTLSESSLPPLQAYYYNNPAKDRKVFDGWNNLSDFEILSLQKLRDAIDNDPRMKDIVPSNFPERDYLRFVQAYKFDIKKTVSALQAHFTWRISYLPCKLTQNAIKLIQQIQRQPEVATIENLQRALIFMMEYAKEHMYLPGHVENWNIIHNVNGLSIGDLPRKELTGVMQAVTDNYMYVLHKAWAVNCTKFQVMCWKVFEVFVDKETAEKIQFFREGNPADIVQSFHPSQLEKRFGGQAESPKVFWPPHFTSNEFGEDPTTQFTPEERQKIEEENPDLVRIPSRLLEQNKTPQKLTTMMDDNGSDVGDEHLNSVGKRQNINCTSFKIDVDTRKDNNNDRNQTESQGANLNDIRLSFKEFNTRIPQGSYHILHLNPAMVSVHSSKVFKVDELLGVRQQNSQETPQNSSSNRSGVDPTPRERFRKNLPPIRAQTMGEDLKQQEMRLFQQKPITLINDSAKKITVIEEEKIKIDSTQTTNEIANSSEINPRSKGIQSGEKKQGNAACCCLIF
ncbi:UNKNOWN [Stylonychia lemnae]|uniref:CRAL-TRIO domain-containing protein n=1 Tax=Stylonychia lemnae TaxID=5949 RepID=A0A078AY64_STYLE|nr:UNKNOWN [Stylonychia lemnae]|eukprot:CDW87109.1 UNKNOWN [Stylonychia lemnae]